MPGRQGQAPVICTGCPGQNSSQQSNAGLKTWPYGSPLINHTGRFVNADQTRSYQGPGVRTLHSRTIRIARDARGSAPPRAYIQLGSVLAVYSLNTFFSTTLPAGPVSASTLVPGARRQGGPVEKAARWDAVVHPEGSQSDWDTPSADSQDRMFDFDFDDRGYVYLAAGLFGWGIVRDAGETGGAQLDLVHQTLTDAAIADPRMIVAVKSASRYYAVVSDDIGASGRHVWDVTNPAAPVSGSTRLGISFAIISYAKDEARGRIAIINAAKTLEIYDAASLVSGGSAMATFTGGGTKKFKDVTVDEDGNFWTVEATAVPENNKLVKLERSGNGYTKRTFDIPGGVFTPGVIPGETDNTIEYGDGYLGLVGRATGNRLDTRLFKIQGGEPVAVELNGFFKNYYWYAPEDYALPGLTTSTFGVYPVEWNNKSYLMVSTNGLGDVFELQGGDSISATQKSGTFGTNNPSSRPTETGPFYADRMKFTSASSNSQVAYDVLWNFDNSESGSANDTNSRTGLDVEHQFTGLNTVGKITQVRAVKATAPLAGGSSDTVNVSLKVPVARMGIGGTDVALTADNSSLELIAGDVLSDASDGTVESHYASWTVDAVQSNLAPNQTVPGGDIGPHTATLSARYGKYDGSFNTVGSPYVDTVSNVSYVVRPFIVAFNTPTTSGNSVTFRGTERHTALTSVMSAINWTVEWSLKSPAGADIVPPVSSLVAIGPIPSFTVADKGAIPSGSILKLKVFVDPLGLIPAAANYASHEVTQELITPDPRITKSGCANAGDPCTLTASSIDGNPISGWTMKWTLRKSGQQVGGVFTGNPFTPTLTEAGSYTVDLTATTTVFAGNASVPPFSVAAALCTTPPTADEMSIFTTCAAGCDVNETITIKGDPFNYQLEDCEEYQWTYGDGTTGTTGPGSNGRTTTHKYTSKGNKTIKLRVKKGTQLSPEFTRTITVGEDDVPPPPPCTAPSNINFTYSGSKGCSPTQSCKVNERVTFSGLRGNSTLLSCDGASWTFHDTTSGSKAPQKTYSSTGSFPVSLVVSNNSGTSNTVTKTLTIVPDDTVASCEAPNPDVLSVTFRGRQSNCTQSVNSAPCVAGEIIDFRSELFPINSPQSCDRFEWRFGDQTTNVTSQTATHTYSSNGTYQASLKWYTTSNSTGITIPLTVPVGNAIPLKKVPELAFSQFPAAGAKGVPVTFTVNVTNLVDVPNATGWVWNFGDGGSPISQAGTGSSTTIQHTYTKTGTFSVSVKARNAEDTANAQTGQAVAAPGVVITDTPEFKYLLPVVVHSPGQNNSIWRTDVQIYTPDPSVTPATPLRMDAKLRNIPATLEIRNSTYTYEDFMRVFTNGNDSGPVIITVRSQYAPQIWTRTYNQTETGTFGQYIPAVRIDAAAGGGSAFGEGKYYIAGLRHGSRFRTNLGFLNPNAQTINATVKVFDDRQLQVGQFSLQLPQYELKQFPITAPEAVPSLSPDRPFSLQIEVPSGQWLIVYASEIDNASGDPMTISGVRESELTLTDYRQGIIPGVGHVGEWRSDITIFNPDAQSVVVDLAYHDQSGAKVAETKSVLIRPQEFLQYTDFLKQGILGNVADSLGILRVTVPDSIPVARFPLTFARTYNDKGNGKTFGQGIGGFAAARANVKPGKPALVAGIRSNSKYYTNVGVTNVSNVPVTATVKFLDPNSGAEQTLQTHNLAPNQSIVGRIVLPSQLETGSLKIEVTGGNVWAFASIVDDGTKDPEYVAATPLAQ
ncbi:MAG: PKD domain-containing protein [Acidobacteriota bacterium]|nr:PKD domain-containing protein [Acidobacteriota bacterium]